MQLAGPKSYYDEYLRRGRPGQPGRVLKENSNPLPHPAGQVTDRGAYINFLEVQLERVSSACMSSSSYEQRFNDVQDVLSGLEQRTAQTTRLLGLAQQCIEEIRSETDNKLVNMMREVHEEHHDIKKTFETLSTRIAVAEQVRTKCSL
jgi:hypothetical protein